MRIVTDGTPVGTRVLDEHGDLTPNVVTVEREGRNVYVTRRYRDLLVEGAPEGDFSITLRRPRTA